MMATSLNQITGLVDQRTASIRDVQREPAGDIGWTYPGVKCGLDSSGPVAEAAMTVYFLTSRASYLSVDIPSQPIGTERGREKDLHQWS
jgi:hypothetical protein